MKHRFLLRWVITVVLSLLTLAFPLTQSNAHAKAAATSHAGMAGMKKVVAPTKASWHVVSSPNPGNYNSLDGVAAVSATDVWAVGNYFNPGGNNLALIEHWDGTSWSVVSNSSPAESQLLGVTAVSATDVWAVGDYGLGTGGTLIEHWDGTSWSVVASPSPTGSELYGVAAVSATDVWAVGVYYDSNSGNKLTLIEQWDGTSWQMIPSPNRNGIDNLLQGVAAVSATDVWAVGSYGNNTLIEQYSS